MASFSDLGVCPELQAAVTSLAWDTPTPIQIEAIPQALQGHDIIGLAETGSGKTAAFALPILQKLLEDPQPFFGLVLTPTRELALQIAEQFEALGVVIRLQTTVLVGGLDSMQQAIALTRKPHVIIGTPGRVLDHIEHTKGFSISGLKFLVLDEADRLLNMDFEKEITKIVAACPQERSTFLFSATMTNKVEKLQRACLRKGAVRVEASNKYSVVSTLNQKYVFIPAKYKDAYLLHVLKEFSGSKTLVFAETCVNAVKLYFLLNKLGLPCVALHGKLMQPKRLSALNKFKSGQKAILVATEVAARGLDIPSVDLVVLYDVPQNAKTYIHKVGRTARAGRAGNAITFVTQYDVAMYQRIEHMIGNKLEEHQVDKEVVMKRMEKVIDAQTYARREMKEADESDEQELDEEGVKPTMGMMAGKGKKRGRQFSYHKQLTKKLKY